MGTDVDGKRQAGQDPIGVILVEEIGHFQALKLLGEVHLDLIDDALMSLVGDELGDTRKVVAVVERIVMLLGPFPGKHRG